MARLRCEICNSETDSSHRARHLRTQKHLRNSFIQQNVIKENPLYHYDDYDFETKCKVCKIKVSNLEKHLKTFSHEKKVNPNMQIFDEVYGPSNQNKNEIYIRCRSCNEEIKYPNRLRHIESISHKEKDFDKEIDVFQTSMKRKFNTVRFYNLNNFKYVEDFFQEKIIQFTKDNVEEFKAIKIKLNLKVEFLHKRTGELWVLFPYCIQYRLH